MQVQFDIVIAVPVVFEEIVPTYERVTRGQVRSDSVLDRQVEEPIVIVIPPSCQLMRGSDKTVFPRDAFLGANIGKGSIPVIVV